MKKTAASTLSDDVETGRATTSPPEPLTLGRKLSSCREAEGLSLEEAAKALHLRPTLLRELENDDLRSFTHASYARLTILGYARFLRIPQSEVQPWLPEIGELATETHQYLDHYATPQPAARRIDYAETRAPAKNPLIGLLKLFLVLVVVLLLGYGWIIYINLGRIQPSGTTGTSGTAVPAAAADEEFVGLENDLDSLLLPSPLLDQDNLILELHTAETPGASPAGPSLLESSDPISLDATPESSEAAPLSLTETDPNATGSSTLPAGEQTSEEPGGETAPVGDVPVLPALPALPALPVEGAVAPDTGESAPVP